MEDTATPVKARDSLATETNKVNDEMAINAANILVEMSKGSSSRDEEVDRKNATDNTPILVELSNGSSSGDAEIDKKNTTDTPILSAKKSQSTETEAGMSLGGSINLDYLVSQLVDEPETVKEPAKVHHSGFLFLIVHLLAAIRSALITEGMKNENWPFLTIIQIVELVKSKPGHQSIHEIKDSLFYLIRHCLKVLSSREAPLGALCWRPLVAYERNSKCWSWIAPITLNGIEVNTTPEWGIPRKTFSKLVSCVSEWLQESQETLQQIADLPSPPAMLTQQIDMAERFKEIKPLTSFSTIYPSTEQVKDYFQKEETLRYSIPDRAFSYTALDGKKSTVVPLINSTGEVSAKSRMHKFLKTTRPKNFTTISLVRDAAARLPQRIGTKGDVCVLARDSQFIDENISDKQLNTIVSGALDRLSWEKDPCVRFDKNKYLWFYLHGERGLEDFEDDATQSRKKEGLESNNL